jgi:hypothetical protein
MTTLREFQAAMAAATIRDVAAIPADVVSDTIPAMARVSVHRNNVRQSLRRAVEACFPSTRLYLGAARFGSLADRFAVAHPPSCGWLSAYGSEFPSFLARSIGAATSDPSADLARLEWLRHLAAEAPSEAPLDWKAWVGTSGADLARMRIRVARGAFCLTPVVPILSIWSTLHGDASPRCRGTGGPSRESLLVARAKSTVVVEAIPDDARALLGIVAGGASVLDVARAFAEADRDPGAFPQALSRLAMHRVLVVDG